MNDIILMLIGILVSVLFGILLFIGILYCLTKLLDFEKVNKK